MFIYVYVQQHARPVFKYIHIYSWFLCEFFHFRANRRTRRQTDRDSVNFRAISQRVPTVPLVRAARAAKHFTYAGVYV